LFERSTQELTIPKERVAMKGGSGFDQSQGEGRCLKENMDLTIPKERVTV